MPKKIDTERHAARAAAKETSAAKALAVVKTLIDDQLVTIDEVCAASRRSKSSVYADIRARSLIIERIGGSTRIRTSILKRYLAGMAMPAGVDSAPLREPACVKVRRARKAAAAEGRAS